MIVKTENETHWFAVKKATIEIKGIYVGLNIETIGGYKKEYSDTEIKHVILNKTEKEYLFIADHCTVVISPFIFVSLPLVTVNVFPASNLAFVYVVPSALCLLASAPIPKPLAP